MTNPCEIFRFAVSDGTCCPRRCEDCAVGGGPTEMLVDLTNIGLVNNECDNCEDYHEIFTLPLEEPEEFNCEYELIIEPAPCFGDARFKETWLDANVGSATQTICLISVFLRILFNIETEDRHEWQLSQGGGVPFDFSDWIDVSGSYSHQRFGPVEFCEDATGVPRIKAA